MYIVYKTTNQISGRFYIGVHNGTNENYLGSGTALIDALKKYGKENFKREVLFECNTLEEALNKEAEIVNEDFVNDERTYNLTIGGGMPPTMHGNAHKLGKKESEDSKKRKRESFAKSKTHAAHLKNVSQDTRLKRSESIKKRLASGWNPMNDPDSRKRVSESKKGLKKLVKGEDSKLARPGSEKWILLIADGYTPLSSFLG